MKRVHIALAVTDFDASVREYSARLGVAACCTVDATYALWRTDQLNLSITVKSADAGRLRHLGFEDDEAQVVGESTDVNGVVWEHFTEQHQREEIVKLWPHAKFRS